MNPGRQQDWEMKYRALEEMHDKLKKGKYWNKVKNIGSFVLVVGIITFGTTGFITSVIEGQQKTAQLKAKQCIENAEKNTSEDLAWKIQVKQCRIACKAKYKGVKYVLPYDHQPFGANIPDVDENEITCKCYLSTGAIKWLAPIWVTY